MAKGSSVSAVGHDLVDQVAPLSSSLVGRRVKIVGLASPQGRRLNGHIGGVIQELDAERVCVRLACGDKSVRKGNLHVWPLHLDDVLDEDACWSIVYQHMQQWPAEMVVFFNAQHRKHYSGPGSRAEFFAQRIHETWNYDRPGDSAPISTFDLMDILSEQLHPQLTQFINPRSVDYRWMDSLMRFGMSLDLLLKVSLRFVAGIDPKHCYVVHCDALSLSAWRSHQLAGLLRAASATGREAEFVGAFDSDDLLRAVVAADMAGGKSLAADSSTVPSQDALPALRMLESALFRRGVSVRGMAEQAKANFRVISGERLRAQMNPERLDRRLARWCAWEERQWLLAFALFRTRGFLPATAAAHIADCFAGPSEAGGQAIQERHALQLLQDIDEPAPRIDPEVAQSQTFCDVLDADEMWADGVQRRIEEEQMAPNPVPRAVEAWGPESVFLLKVGGDNVEGLRQRLLHGPEFKPCREALLAAPEPRSCELPEKALVFVKPQHYNAVRRAIVDKKLRYYHIIIAEGFEYLLEETLQAFPCRKRATLKKPFETLRVDPLGVHGQEVFIEDRTFVCVGPTLAAASQFCQSTTEAVVDSHFHYSFPRGVNPRRVISADVSDPPEC